MKLDESAKRGNGAIPRGTMPQNWKFVKHLQICPFWISRSFSMCLWYGSPSNRWYITERENSGWLYIFESGYTPRWSEIEDIAVLRVLSRA